MKFIRFSLAAFALAALLSSCQQDSNDAPSAVTLVEKSTPIPPLGDKKPMSWAEVDDFALSTLKERKDFRWEWLDDYTFWSFVNVKEPIVAIGYKPLGAGDIHPILHKIDLQAPEWRDTREALKAFVVNALNEASPATAVRIEDILVEDDPVLPILTLRISSYEVLARLRRMEQVRYVEPLDYGLRETDSRSSSGCSGSAASSLPAADYTTTTPAAKISWNFNNHNIPAAWNTATGAGIGIGLIDAGLSSSQPLLNASFASGASTGRTITANYTYGSSAYTSCSHGTSMSGLAAGPRNNTGATVGVAYQSNLVFYRGCDDVVLDASSERTGVRNALTALGNNASVKVISMSLGTPFYSSTLEDGVVYANNMGKLVFAAAGTSFSWTSWWGVIYPAAHPQCVAMTGRKENGNTCDVCHDGSQVDFTIVMERTADASRNALSLHTSGNTPAYVGGSSTATAMGAGIAALVWSVKPTLTAAQVRSILQQTAQYSSPGSSHGYGNLNAQAAVLLAQTY